MRKSILAVAMTASASVVLATALAPAANAQEPAANNTAAANAIVKQYSSTPTSINITTKLKTNPQTLPTKFIVGLTNGGDENKVLDEGIAAAGKVLGWTFKEILAGATPEDQRAGFSAALALKPDGIHISGIEPSTIGDLLDKAKAANIAVDPSCQRILIESNRGADTLTKGVDFNHGRR